MSCTPSEEELLASRERDVRLLTRALADVGEGRHVALGADLREWLDEATRPKANGALADVAIVRVRAITSLGDVAQAGVPDAREVWAILASDAAPSPFVDALATGPTVRVKRIYHALAVAEVGDDGVVLREVVKGKSARDVARVFGVPCLAGPDLAEWRDADASRA